MKQYALILAACYISVSACSVASLQQEKPQTSQHSQNLRQEQIVPQQEATPPEDKDKQIYEIPEGVKKRIEFKRGRNTATVTGRVVRMSEDEYIFSANVGQKLSVSITSIEENAFFYILSADNTNLSGTEAIKNWSGKLPTAGDYTIYVGSGRGNANYKIQVTIR